MSNDDTLVSVVIPAYNAQATLDETLSSVRAQTHQTLEIIVVDDGSTDGTHALAERHAAADARIRVLHQANAGVAAARNAGWQHSRAEFIAFVDADDLWAPTKIERQLAALVGGGPRIGLAYCWMARIDQSGNVLRHYGNIVHEGEVFDPILGSNFVGNGSAALVRRQALEDTGGFDSGLRAAGAEGCEDWLFYARVAARHEFALVPDYLVGYRDLSDNMSSNRDRMFRSNKLMCDRIVALHPRHSASAWRGLQNYGFWLLLDTNATAGLRASATLAWTMLRARPQVALKILLRDVPLEPMRRLRKRLGRLRRRLPPRRVEGTGKPFLSPAADRE